MTIINKNISFKSSELLDKLQNQNLKCFGISEAYRLLNESNQEAVRRLLSNMTNRGLLMRIKEGLYYVIPFEQDANEFMPDWHLLSKYLVGNNNYYIGYYSALQIHSLTTQPNLKEQIVVNEQIKPTILRVRNVPFQFIYHNKKHFFGFKKYWIDNFNKVEYSDIEKTIVDCLFIPVHGNGIVEISKAIYKSKDKIDFGNLYNHVIKFESQAVIKRLGFLLELLEIKNPITNKLSKIIRNSPILLEPSYPKTGKVHTRWALQQNIESNDILSPIFS